MARLLTTGFELNSLVSDVEVTNASGTTGTGSIQTSIVRSGTYAYRNNPAGTIQTWGFQFAVTGDALKTAYVRFWYYITTQPANDSLVFTFLATDGTTVIGRLRGTSTGLKFMNAPNTQVGSSFTLATGRWHCIQMRIFSHVSAGEIDVWANETLVVNATSVNTNGANLGSVNLGSAAALTHDYYIDDLAVNNNVGSDENAYPSAHEKVICLRPNAAGSVNSWSRGGADSGANWSQCDEVTPNDATDYVQANTAGATDFYNVSPSGIGPHDTVTVVQTEFRHAQSVGDGIMEVQLLNCKAPGGVPGTTGSSASMFINNTAWRTGISGGFTPPSILQYLDPDGLPWTQATLDEMFVGVTITVTGTQQHRVSAIWVMVAYLPNGPQPQPADQRLNTLLRM